MAILRVYLCPKHGVSECFDDEPRCRIKRCKADLQEMIASPAIIHRSTKRTDATVAQLAADYKMTDVKSTREGEAQKGGEQKGKGVLWGQMGKVGLDQIVKGGPPRPIHDEPVGLQRREMGTLTGPLDRGVIVRRDHENLKVDK
jgi:hypothetical protein